MTSGDNGAGDAHRRAFDLDEARALLALTPRLLSTWLTGVPEAWTRAREGEGTWSPVDVVRHLAHGERTDWMPRVRILLEHGEGRPFDAFDREASVRDGVGRSLREALDDFAAARGESLDALDALALGPADLERRGTHPAFGPVTLRQLLATWVAHDQDHLMQIARVLGRQYGAEVGPWRAYLRVVSGEPG